MEKNQYLSLGFVLISLILTICVVLINPTIFIITPAMALAILTIIPLVSIFVVNKELRTKSTIYIGFGLGLIITIIYSINNHLSLLTIAVFLISIITIMLVKVLVSTKKAYYELIILNVLSVITLIITPLGKSLGSFKETMFILVLVFIPISIFSAFLSYLRLNAKTKSDWILYILCGLFILGCIFAFNLWGVGLFSD